MTGRCFQALGKKGGNQVGEEKKSEALEFGKGRQDDVSRHLGGWGVGGGGGNQVEEKVDAGVGKR